MKLKHLAEEVEAARNGDMEAFRRLVDRYSNAVYAVIYSKLGDFHLAQDLAQETFLKAFLHLPQLKEAEKFGGWLLTTAVRLTADWHRSFKNKQPIYSDSELVDDSFDDTIERRHHRMLVWDALSILDDDSRSAVLMQMYGYSLEEIGVFLQSTPSAVDSRLRRAKSKLKEELIMHMENDVISNRLGNAFADKVVSSVMMPSDIFFPNDNLSGSILNKLKKKFAKKFPHVKLNTAAVTNYADKLYKFMAEGTAPDIIVLGNENYAEYARRGWMLDLRPYLEADGYDPAQFVGPSLELATVEGRIVGIPMTVATTAVFYNKNWFAEAGLTVPAEDWTWEAFADAAAKLQALHGDPSQWKYGAALLYHTNILEMLALGKGGGFISPDGTAIRGYLDHESTQSALQWVAAQIHDRQVFAPMVDYGFRRLFWEGRLGMIVDYVDAYPVLEEQMGDTFGVAPLPYFQDGVRINVAASGGLGISASAQNPDMAWAFIREALLQRSPLTEAYAQTEIGNTYPLLQELGHLKDDRRSIFVKELQHAVAGAGCSGSLWNVYYKEQINARLRSIISDKNDVKETLRWAVEGIESHLEQLRKQR